MKPFTAHFLFASLLIGLPTVASAQGNYQRDYEQAEFYEDYYPNHVEKRGPIRDFFRDVAGEVRHQRDHFWDDMRDLKHDVRRAFRNETPKERNAREAAQMREAEQRFANRFGYQENTYQPSPNPRPTTQGSIPATPGRRVSTDVPMDGRFFEHEPPAVPNRPVTTRPTTPSPNTNGSVNIVRPTPSVGADVPAQGNTAAANTSSQGAANTSRTPTTGRQQSTPPRTGTTTSDPEKEVSKPKDPAPKKEAASPKKENVADQYPFATKTKRDGIVLSPFAPHDELDVTGMKSGDFAMDPGNGRIFRVP
ncbi:MAG: hypothetical protein AAGJ79_15245 [Verrucomicrobiota bacterium]